MMQSKIIRALQAAAYHGGLTANSGAEYRYQLSLKSVTRFEREHTLIRAEEQRDWAAVHAVNVSAFETPAEANLVDALREQAQPLVSLIAEDNGAIVGHIMFSPVSLSGNTVLKIMGLAPMAVAPEHQRKGIGSALVRAGLEQCKQLGIGAVVVLGHPTYYPRFGFLSSTSFGIGCEYEVPEEVFMVVELEAGFLRSASGKVKYHAAFSNV
jgi:putative acetyltransferase